MTEEILSKKIRSKVLDLIEPTKKEKINIDNCVQEFLEILKISAEKLNINTSIVFGGSYAKGTYIRNDFDVDVFFQFDNSIEDFKKTKFVEEILNYSKINCNVEQGSRVYFSGDFKSKKNNQVISFECVPTQKFKSIDEVENSTDLSIYHVEVLSYKKNELKKKKIDLENEIRLSKMWFKAKKLYGAESYIEGFSGHSIECLTAHLETFENVITYLADMQENQNISMDVDWDVSKISKDKLSPLIIQDPVVVGRNALSALSKEVFQKAKFQAILAKNNSLSVKDFITKKKTLKEIKSDFFSRSIKSSRIEFEFKFKNTTESSDIIGSKSRKILFKISNELKRLDFSVLNISFEYVKNKNIAYGLIELKELNLSQLKLIKGPDLNLKSEIILNFLSNHSIEDIEIKDSILYVRKKREILSIKDFFKQYSSTEKITIQFLNKEFKSLKNIKYIIK